jgi:mannan endo-1,4-beta-mannosidase
VVCILYVLVLPRAIWLTKVLPSQPAEAKRWSGGVGSAFDGSQGVDSEDILNIPEIDFGSFQLFPDQNSYSTIASPFSPPSANFNETVKQGIAWIEAQAASAKA